MIDIIHIIYLGILVLGVILFSILNFKALKDIKNSFEEYKELLEKNLRRKKEKAETHNLRFNKLDTKVKKKFS